MYRPYDDECWMLLAKSIVSEAAEEYSNQFPKFCSSRNEFETLDTKSYAPIRKSILRRICNGPVKALADPETFHDAFEKRRKEAMQDFKIHCLK